MSSSSTARYTRTLRGLLDAVIFVSVCCAFFMLPRVVKPHKRGFFCNDESLAYPYQENTVSLSMLLAIAVGLPPLVIIVVELFKQATRNAANDSACRRFGQRLFQCLVQLGYFFFGLELDVFAMQLSKYCIGRLRPHFFDVCQPLMADGSSCLDAQNRDKYIEHYSCANPNATDFQLSQLPQSFPSGHACIIFYAMTYLAIYLQAVLSTRVSSLLKHLLQFACIMYAVYVALTRISDHWHHWSDVLAGTVLGVTLAYLLSIHVADLFAFKRVGSYRTLLISGNGSANGRNSAKSAPSPKHAGKSNGSSGSIHATLPAYTFGTLPYMAHPAQAQYAQTYHNYGYVS